MRLLASALATCLATLWTWTASNTAAGTWLTCTTRTPLSSRHSGVAAAKRRTRKARNRRRQQYGRA